MGIELIHADSDMNELSCIDCFTCFDAQICLSADEGDNDWMLELPRQAWLNDRIEPGHYVYINGSEWGGVAERVKHSAADAVVRVYGTCWRGMLARRAICPAEGETHVVTETLEGNAMLSFLLDGWRSDLFAVSDEVSDITCAGSIRYLNMLDAVYDMLEEVGGRLCVSFADGIVSLSVGSVRDRSEEVELSQDFDIRVTSELGMRVYNHIVALGCGEMEERLIAELWVTDGGVITDDASAEGIPSQEQLNTYIYDYSAVESLSELKSAAKKKLLEYYGAGSMEIELSGEFQLELTDRVAVSDEVMGLAAIMRVTTQNINISESAATVRHTLG